MRSLNCKPSWKRLTSSAKTWVLLSVLGAMMMSGCSTMGVDVPKNPPPVVDFSSYCPPPQTFASWHDFTQKVKVQKGESPFTTVKRFRLAEAERNAAAQRLWTGMKACRAKKVEVEVTTTVKKKQQAVSDILAGGL